MLSFVIQNYQLRSAKQVKKNLITIQLKFTMNRLINRLPLKVYFSQEKPQKIIPGKISTEYKKIWSLCRPQMKKYLFNAGLTIIHAALFMYIPNIYTDLNHLMELKVSVVPASEIYGQYLLMTGKWAAVFGFLGALTYRRRFQFIDISNRIGIRLRNVLYRQILQRDFYKHKQIPQTFVHHLITDIKTVSQFTGQAIFMGLRGVCFLIGGVLSLVYTSPQISMIAVSIMIAFNLLFRKRNETLKNLKEQENSVLVNLSEFSSERFHNMKLIKISNTELFQQYKFVQELKRFYEYSKKVAYANGINYGSLECFGLFSLFAVAASGSLLLSMEITSFSLIASSTYALYVAMGFRQLMFFNAELMKIFGVYANIQKKLGDLSKLPDYNEPFFLDNLQVQEQKLKKLFQKKYSESEERKGVSIKIKNMNFTYIHDNHNKPIRSNLYRDFNIDIEQGETLALIGDSGTGKSTLFNLITKLSQPDSGQIYIDDKQINTMTFQYLQHIVSYVTQDSYLFTGTFEQNIIYGNHGFDLSEQNIKRCLKMVNAYDLVMNKGGLKSKVTEKGGNLSGGQKQRIILARALIKHPKLLLLDEATSGIDSDSQQLIIESIKSFKDQMTVIIITHKLEPFKSIIDRTIQLQKQEDTK